MLLDAPILSSILLRCIHLDKLVKFFTTFVFVCVCVCVVFVRHVQCLSIVWSVCVSCGVFVRRVECVRASYVYFVCKCLCVCGVRVSCVCASIQ